MKRAHEILRQTFGFDSFRGVQKRVVDRVMAGEHTLAVMPTGAGKSLCYQLPALARDGTALVVSPLIALMHDQIRSADAAGIRAASLTSADSDRERTVERLRAGDLDLLYVAPERATTDSFRRLIAQVPLARRITARWSEPEARASATWQAHEDINAVMLATSLAPSGYLDFVREDTQPVRSAVRSRR